MMELFKQISNIVLPIIFVLFFVVAGFYWIKLMKRIHFLENSTKKNKLYFRGGIPKEKNFFKVCFGNWDFNDEKIRKYKKLLRINILISFGAFFLLIFMSIFSVLLI